ncbi:uncharacterized protein PFL1_06849 [Pseudozyma flocculosa PF-1]|uniref:Complex 1 LYR protein domain-containing protein n=1 Tax=Pseudozyma flocculosa TaxID=84751 RepID=A0A5C3EXJ6_9BASI|nr:uncharacterized protein PFL1_06849 [Pseudozyma flocculosa PF-1]EPQ30973.1 hypothetical protein PFL1_06849 [Pseudozyma flocculosa PF-1]SPO35811.1 uncharacterized protein PSFLO_01282 [Pseudozyma flocculosa]
MPPLGHPLRPRAIGLYKHLHRLGRSYPDPSYNFLGKLRSMFAKNAALTDMHQVEEKLKLAEFVAKETETLYSLKKYRTLKRRYYADSDH